MNKAVLLLLSVLIGPALCLECRYEERKDGHQTTTILQCEQTCCTDKSECCDPDTEKTWNPWMIYSFAVVGVIALAVIVLIACLVIKKTVKPHAQVNTSNKTESDEDLREDSKQVDVSIFHVNCNCGRPPDYMAGGCKQDADDVTHGADNTRFQSDGGMIMHAADDIRHRADATMHGNEHSAECFRHGRDINDHRADDIRNTDADDTQNGNFSEIFNFRGDEDLPPPYHQQ